MFKLIFKCSIFDAVVNLSITLLSRYFYIVHTKANYNITANIFRCSLSNEIGRLMVHSFKQQGTQYESEIEKVAILAIQISEDLNKQSKKEKHSND